jgi:hypothetical protein
MKSPRIAIIFVLSLAVWILYRWKEPDAPLGPVETLVVVFVIGAVVFAASWAIKKVLTKEKAS